MGGDDSCSKIAAILAVSATVVVLATAFGFMLFAQPQADDFCCAVHGRDLGWYGYAKSIYLHWSGRWSGHALLAGVLGLFDPTRYYAVLLGMLGGLSLLAYHVALKVVLGEQISRRAAFLLTTVFFALLWVGRPSPGDSFYWFSGGVPYLLSIVLSLFLVASLARPGPGVRRLAPSLFRVTALSFLAIFIMGLHELVGLMLCVVLAAGTFIAFRIKSRHRLVWAFVLGAGIVGLLIVFVAPGNAERAALMGPPDIGQSFKSVISDFKSNIPGWILDPRLLAATLFLAINPRLSRIRPRWLTWPGIPWKIIVPGIWILLLSGGFVGPRLAFTEGPMPGRITDYNYTVFLVGWFATIFVWTRWSVEPPTRQHASLRSIESASLVVLAVALLFSGNMRLALVDLWQGRPMSWSQSMVDRYETARRAKEEGVTDLVVNPPFDPPRVFVSVDLKEDRNFHGNRCFAQLFGFKSVVLAPALPTTTDGG